mgnify:CR=1 FL=1
MLDESELVERATSGDMDALGALFDRYTPDVYRVARSMGYAAVEAEDLMQDTFLAAFEGVLGFKKRSTFKTWLLAILFRQSNHRRRYLRIRKTESLDDASTTPHDGRPVEAARNERRLDVHAMLDTLSPDHRSVLVLRELEGFSYEDIASTLKIPRGTVESRLFRARAILRERFQEYGGHDGATLPENVEKRMELRHE